MNIIEKCSVVIFIVCAFCSQMEYEIGSRALCAMHQSLLNQIIHFQSSNRFNLNKNYYYSTTERKREKAKIMVKPTANEQLLRYVLEW